MNSKKDLEYLIEKICISDLFWEANYYFRCMKKLPHGGVARIFTPNVYLRHYPADTLTLFRNNLGKVPFFLQPLVDEVFREYLDCEIDMEELLWFCFDDDKFWYAGHRLLNPREEYIELNKSLPLLWCVIDSKGRFQDYFEVNSEDIVFALVCLLISSEMILIDGVEDISNHEKLHKLHNKYGLTLVNEAEFLRQGFVFDNKYYLYNLFLDTTINSFTDQVPYTIRIIQDEIEDSNLFMRCDEKLAVPATEILSTATMDFQKIRGITMDFKNIEQLVYKKETVVHFDTVSFDKVVMTIKKDSDEEGKFYHFAVEELWNPNKIRDNIVLTNFIHAKYYPHKKAFNHIDFSVNQYEKKNFETKYRDSVSDTNVPIDKYADKHYKVWCVESEKINIETWGKLVNVTLDEPFRDIFLEMFSNLGL